VPPTAKHPLVRFAPEAKVEVAEVRVVVALPFATEMREVEA
jgi:hypothetical protein